jgi:hypothetical protein
MPRVVPSQVVSFINQTFPWLRAPGQGSMGLNRQHCGEAAGLLRLIDEIPNELLVMGSREYTEFVCRVPHSPVLRVRVLTCALAHCFTLSLQREPLQLLNASFPSH